MEILSCKLSLLLSLALLSLFLLRFSANRINQNSCSAIASILVILIFSSVFLALHRNLLLLNFNDAPATKSIVRLSAPEAESIVEYFLATMYGGQELVYPMNGNMIESSMIPGSTGMSPSPTMIQQQHPIDLYSNGNAGMIASLRTHSSKFPVSQNPLLMSQNSIVQNFERGFCFESLSRNLKKHNFFFLPKYVSAYLRGVLEITLGGEYVDFLDPPKLPLSV